MPNLIDEVLLGVEGLEFIQHTVGSIEGSELYLITVALTFLKIRDPLLSLQLDVIVKSGAIFVVSHRGANSGSSPVEISFGPAECATGSFELVLECLDPRLSCNS